MSKNIKELNIFIFIILIFLFVFSINIFFISKTKNQNISVAQNTNTTLDTKPAVLSSLKINRVKTQTLSTVIESKENTQSISISAGDETIQFPFSNNTSLYDALMQAKNASKIEFSGKNYLGLGFFVTDIGTLHAGNGKHLLYYINGKEATVGVSSYTLVSGDTIEWKLK